MNRKRGLISCGTGLTVLFLVVGFVTPAAAAESDQMPMLILFALLASIPLGVAGFSALSAVRWERRGVSTVPLLRAVRVWALTGLALTVVAAFVAWTVAATAAGLLLTSCALVGAALVGALDRLPRQA
ncbi:hypothetical protein [Actinoplanes utahensis]|uniref:Uncharacterized protein n=1 Tax=Actinoplanes utahensis TaxID=1869 RepID=A0A0A6UPN2_ACTUT|nr:hypothetical protein [Actinoplanes utahensis]KHD78105.1 hypothetical protein MB27_06340 [Actinoplanes utahensis]GIF30563.1 hypothetical protein Aut01nite_35490 [Actinoplanes utahensis]